MKSTPTAPMEALLNLTPLALLIMAEERMALYRLHVLKQPAVSETEVGFLSIWKMVNDPIFCVGRTTLFQVIIIPEFLSSL
jgi:hypothetical protein